MVRRKTGILAMIIAAAVAASGCQYMEDRGRDAADIFDIGLTVTPDPEPEFALFADFFTITPIGYTNLEDTKQIGICNRQVGVLDLEHKSWGYLVDGEYKAGGGTFNPADPHQAPAGYELCERPTYDIGWMPRENPPSWTHYVECDRVVHLGWIGVRLVCRPVDVLDFVLGWTTLDFMGDDGLENPCAAE